MIAPFFIQRIPAPLSALLTFTTILIQSTTTNAHVLPQPTKTVEHRQLNVVSWPLLPTQMPRALGSNDYVPIFPRQEPINTICGYIGGHPDFPATCFAGTHCVVDVKEKAVGCCPDGVPCTEGIYTGCVDSRNGRQTELNPYVFTCGGESFCYQNVYPGGFSQFGCGVGTIAAGTVLPSANGRQPVDLPTIAVALTAPPQTIPGADQTITNQGPTAVQTSKSAIVTNTLDDSQSTESHNGSKTLGAVDEGGSKEEGKKSSNTGIIVGGVVGAIAVVIILMLVAFFVKKRKDKKKADLDTSQIPPATAKQMTYQKSPSPVIRPMRSHPDDFIPTSSPQSDNNSRNLTAFRPPPMDESDYLPRPSISGWNDSPTVGRVPQINSNLDPPRSPFNHHPPSSIYSMPPTVGLALGGSSVMDDDSLPLTRRSEEDDPSTVGLAIDDDYDGYGQGNGYMGSLNPITEVSTASNRSVSDVSTLEAPRGFRDDDDQPVSGCSSPYTPRRGGSGAFWSQNRDSMTRPGSGWL